MRSLKLFTIIPLLLLIFLTLSCSDSTKPKKASVVGVVALEGLNSFEGVSVWLYKTGLVDEDIQAVHNEHPSIGFELADIHVFDHREYAPVYTTTTSSDGSFEVKGVERDKYILVLLKEGFGPRYLYDLELASDVVEVNNGEDIHLFEVIDLPQYVDGEFVFESGKTYIVHEDVMFLPESNVTFEGGSTLLINPGRGVTCHGTISFEGTTGNPIRISSSDRMFETNVDVAQFTKFEITELANSSDIEGLLYSHSSDGLVLAASEVDICYCSFVRNNTSCLLSAASNNAIRNVYFGESDGTNGTGISLHEVANLIVENSVFNNMGKRALSIVVGSGIIINNCWFQGGRYQIYNSYDSDTFIENSTFKGSQYNITNTGRSNLSIQYCDISGEICVYTYHSIGNTLSSGWTIANHNNLNASLYTVRATALFYTYQHEYVPLDFKNNFWSSSNRAEIEESIIDYNDLEPHPSPGNIWPLIEYVPFRTSKVVNAGVQ